MTVGARSECGLFPLDMVLLPGERVALHLFEPRYRQLYADCVLEERPFVLLRASGERAAEVGCSARFDELIRRHDDGRLDVVVLGLEPVRVLAPSGGRLYNTAQVEHLGDGGAPAAAADRTRLVARYLEFVGVDPYEDELLPLSYGLGGTLPLSDDIKQSLLDERDEARRVALLTAAIDRALAADAAIAEALHRAGQEGEQP